MHSRKCWSHVASMQQEGRRRKLHKLSTGTARSGKSSCNLFQKVARALHDLCTLVQDEFDLRLSGVNSVSSEKMPTFFGLGLDFSSAKTFQCCRHSSRMPIASRKGNGFVQLLSAKLKILKAASVLRASNSLKIMEVASQVALRVDDASVGDLLIPSVSSTSEQWNLSKDWYLPFIHKQINRLVCVCDCGLTEEVTPYQYDVDIVMIMLEEFLLQGKSPGSDNPPRRSKGDFAFTTTVPKENSK
nr:BTB/POZ domain-containing protein At1g67900-like [Ipomoea batatas]